VQKKSLILGMDSGKTPLFSMFNVDSYGIMAIQTGRTTFLIDCSAFCILYKGSLHKMLWFCVASG